MLENGTPAFQSEKPDFETHLGKLELNNELQPFEIKITLARIANLPIEMIPVYALAELYNTLLESPEIDTKLAQEILAIIEPSQEIFQANMTQAAENEYQKVATHKGRQNMPNHEQFLAKFKNIFSLYKDSTKLGNKCFDLIDNLEENHPKLYEIYMNNSGKVNAEYNLTSREK